MLQHSGHPEARNSNGGDQSGILVMGYFPGESIPLLCVLSVKTISNSCYSVVAKMSPVFCAITKIEGV